MGDVGSYYQEVGGWCQNANIAEWPLFLDGWCLDFLFIIDCCYMVLKTSANESYLMLMFAV